ncbi:MAG: Asp-tRNA(Asn)/Glu-tRNA(Gln) amidotransferase subunit GatB [Candidatus Methylomirabilis oxygeniifera]|uniref:Aspartyl/glutamyl-tRNA(Asn/Gln) amidotransferase subunit B n=1 Tax=Methylomirabilis oxygeniifera TaxID=671143 RepID=D5MLK4_METO1|nr:MAG: Asp-tRNA(Asn)/Glu-tRNA(Gln) amidotransferase subunit GatB [Candidatus Methylomirabilis oxyfera]CBE67870.1 Aspartyl/glutamyl-tRNA(Asn/Gln) amidotransferase subunit B (Asp/Glu-ADT subunit B) [Candidatus Methylomirabilis oxyfera]
MELNTQHSTLNTEYEAVIGLEVHAQLLTRSKIFCGCSAAFGAPPNSQTCPVCLGMPGALPVLNRRVVEFAIKTALALGCDVTPVCRFHRKNYFYPDMPKNYQISQYELPLAWRGSMEFPVDGTARRVRIHRLHLEEDVGKLLHAGTLQAADYSLVDFNRSGVPLMEIVSEPDIRSPEEAAEYLRQLRAILVYLNVCDGNMEEGSLRCDANVSLRHAGSEELGVKAEVKNMNSFKSVQRALAYEIQRQTQVLQEGGRIVQETRLWDADQEVTLSMRSKEHAHDYRYFLEPDLVPLAASRQWIDEIRTTLPELPQQRRARFVEEYGIPDYDAAVLTASKSLADYYEKVARTSRDSKVASNWVMVELLGHLNKDGRDIADSPISPTELTALLALLHGGTISGKIAKTVFEQMYQTGKSAELIVKEQGLTQISDQDELRRIVEEVLAAHPGPVADYRKGKVQSLTFLIGMVMKSSRGKANPPVARELLLARLNSEETGGDG